MNRPQLTVGQLFEERYQLVEFLGTGGFSTVFRAIQTDCNRTVAVKILSDDQLADANSRDRFKHEAQALAKLEHKNILQIYHLGVGKDSRWFIVMEYVSGASLAELLGQRKIHLSEALSIIKDLSEALELVHSHDILHRDIKPSNILMAETPSSAATTPKLIDFGLARIEGSSDPRLTESNVLLGTPHYMSPEQCQGKPSDKRSDIYALSACFYEMLAQKPLFTADTAVGIMYQHTNAPIPQLNDLQTDGHSTEVNKILSCGLAKSPSDRFQTMQDLNFSIKELQNTLMRETQPSGAKMSTIAKSRHNAVLIGTCAALSTLIAIILIPPHKPQTNSLSQASTSSRDEETLKREIARYEKSLDSSKSLMLAKCLGELADLYGRAENKPSEAEPLLIRSLEIKKHVLGESDATTLRAVQELAGCQANQGKYGEAADLLSHYLSKSQPENLDSADTIADLALYRYKQGKFTEAEPQCELALKRWRARPDSSDAFEQSYKLLGIRRTLVVRELVLKALKRNAECSQVQEQIKELAKEIDALSQDKTKSKSAASEQ